MSVAREDKILVSACLAGFDCRYDGGNNLNEEIVELVRKGEAIPVCPEQLGGLTTPRNASEIKIEEYGEVKVYNIDGLDVTKQFYEGASKTLKIAKLYSIRTAILKSRSPSCGCGKIYSGEFNGRLIEGDGITTKLLKDNGIKIISDSEYKERAGL